MTAPSSTVPTSASAASQRTRAATRRSRAGPCAPRTSSPPATRSRSTGRSRGSAPPTARRRPAIRVLAPGNEGRIVAYGLRNPFRFAVRPGSDELWIADVGWTTAEEINATPLDRVTDFGWPCFEGKATQARYVSRGTPICNTLYANHAVTPPWFAYRHGAHVAAGENCPASLPAAISGVSFDRGSAVPVALRRGAPVRRLHPRLHLGRRSGALRPPRARGDPGLRDRCGRPDRPRVGPGGHLVRRHRVGSDPPDQLHPADRRGEAANPPAGPPGRDRLAHRARRRGGHRPRRLRARVFAAAKQAREGGGSAS